MSGPVDLARGWVLKGDSDVQTARLVLTGPGPYDTTCFHAQQAAEKYLKAVVALAGVAIPRTHDLEVVLAECQKIEPRLALDRARLAILTPYAVQLRYNADFWPDVLTAREALAIAEEVRRGVAAVLSPTIVP